MWCPVDVAKDEMNLRGLSVCNNLKFHIGHFGAYEIKLHFASAVILPVVENMEPSPLHHRKHGFVCDGNESLGSVTFIFHLFVYGKTEN